MKKLVSIIILCLGCLGILEAQENIWKPINGTAILGAGPDGSIFAYGEYGNLSRSQDDGETWQIVLGQETGFTGHINSSCFAVSPEGRICVFNDNQQTVVYSDDSGDTWQQTTVLSLCGMPTKAGVCAPTNDIMVVWAENGEISYTLDGGVTWEGWILDFLENSESVSDLLVNENGDVYVSVDYYIMNIVGIYHSTLSGIQNWELVAFEGISIKDMAFDPEGNVVACGYNVDGSSAGFQHIPGFYLFDGTSLAISDEGIVYTPRFMGLQAVLSYSTDHGEHFTETGEHLPLVDIAPGGDNPRLFKGYDNHLYFDGGGEYWKSVQNADEIVPHAPYHPIVEDGKQWNVLFSYPWSPPEPQHKYTDIYKIEGDTLVDGVSYKVMYTTRNENLTSWSVCGVIRETEDKQVLYRRDGSAYDEILYDFSMEVGDTIIMNGSGFYPDWMFVVETNEILINGEPRKQIVLEYSWGDQEVWIEGIGSLYGIIDSGSLFLTGGSTNLLCYYEDGDLVWQNTTPGYDECYIVNTGQQGSFVVAPSTLTFEEPFVPQTFTIYNQTDEAVTISSINVQPDDNMVLLSYGELPRTLQPNETMNVEVEVNGVGNKGYNTYRVNVATSIGYRQVTVRVKDDISLYYPLVHEGNDRQKWNVVYILANDNYPNDYHTEIQSIRDNINLDGVDYKLVWTESVYDSKRIAGAVREEDKRVYYRRKLSQSYEEEVLLYDFNLTVGDTVTVNWFGQPLTVIEETEVEVDGTMRRKLVFGPEEYWIEGVGSSYGFLNSGYENWMGSFVHLLCYHENGDLVWDNEAFDDCVMNSDGTLASFAPQGAEWYFHVWSQGPITEPPFSYIRKTVSGVEEVQGHTCSVIDLYDYVYEEDNIVYWYNQDNDAFTVLYDFNAEAGESWYCDIADCSFLVTVQSVDSVTWNNRTYRTQYVAGCYADNLDNVVFEGRIIDGIGYEKGLFFNWGSCGIICGADYEYMRCYLEDGELLYHEGDYDCDYVPGSQPQQPQFEWYYEIQNEDGSITYQYMYQAGDTIINDEPTHILVKINTLYDKGLRDEVTHEYVYERDGKVYWWNKTLEVFTVLYDYEAEVGDYWEIVVGTRTIDMHVDAVEEIEYEGRVWRMLRVSDPEDLFSGDIVCGIGHLTSFFPEKLLGNRDGVRVEGMRCYWSEGELVFKYGDEDCDAVISDLHGVEEDSPSTGSETLMVYPNPTNGVLFVETHGRASLNQTYHITNLMGQNLLTGQITADNQQINVSSLPQGMYFITCAGETRKFVVQ